MAFGKKKPLPTRRGRARPEAAAAPAETPTEAPAETEVTEVAEEPSARPVAARRTAASGGGFEMALIVVTLVTLIAAFALLQLEMHKAFGAGWPI